MSGTSQRLTTNDLRRLRRILDQYHYQFPVCRANRLEFRKTKGTARNSYHLGLSNIVRCQCTSDRKTNRNLTSVVNRTTFACVADLSRYYNARHKRYTTRLIIVNVIFRRLLMTDQKGPNHRCVEKDTRTRERTVTRRLYVTLRYLANTYLSARHTRSPPGRRAPSTRLTAVNTRNATDSLLGIRSTFSLTTSACTVSTGPVLTAVSTTFRPASYNRVVRRAVH